VLWRRPAAKAFFPSSKPSPRQAKCSSYWLDNVTQMLWGEKMRLVYKNVKKIYMGIVGVVFIVMTLSVIYQVLCRYVLHIAAPWTEEFARYSMLGVTFLGAPIVSSRGDHLGAFFLRDRAEGRLKGLMSLVSNIVTVGFLTFIIIGSVKMAELTYTTISSTISFFRMAYIYYGVIFGCVVMIIYSCKDLSLSIKLLATGKGQGFAKNKSMLFVEKGEEEEDLDL